MNKLTVGIFSVVAITLQSVVLCCISNVNVAYTFTILTATWLVALSMWAADGRSLGRISVSLSMTTLQLLTVINLLRDVVKPIPMFLIAILLVINVGFSLLQIYRLNSPTDEDIDPYDA
jgi:hypothetical protein